MLSISSGRSAARSLNTPARPQNIKMFPNKSFKSFLLVCIKERILSTCIQHFLFFPLLIYSLILSLSFYSYIQQVAYILHSLIIIQINETPLRRQKIQFVSPSLCTTYVYILKYYIDYIIQCIYIHHIYR